MRDRLIVFLSAALFVASQVNLAVIVAPLHPSILSLQLAFTPEAFWHVIELWGASGLALYQAHFQFDNVHPFIYGTFGFLLVSRTSLFSSARPLVYRAILLLLPVAGLFDLVENTAHIYLLDKPRGFNSVIIPFSATCSLIKWVLASLFASVVTIQVARKLWANPAMH
jgi:hypothetical protein